MKKFYCELAYLIGIAGLALGTALMARADFGVSMVVAPAYVLHLKISEFLPFFSFGMAEYTFQAFLIVLMCIVLRRFRVSYLFSFATAVFYGVILDLCSALLSLISANSFPFRVVEFAVGIILSTSSVSLLFHSYISPEAYELFVKELSRVYSLNIDKVKITYDLISCAAAALMSFLFFGFGNFRGVGWGTLITALINGLLIAMFSRIFEKTFDFKDGLSLRKFFEKDS